jgi:hypothetical protein
MPAPLPKPPGLPVPPSGATGLHAAHPPGLFGRLLMLHSTASEQVVEALTDRLAEDAAAALSGLQDRVRAEFEAATDMTDLAERLAALQLDSKEFAVAMQRGLALANLAGQADLLAEIGGRPHASRHAAARADLADSDFAVPGKRKLRIDDETHVRLAWDMVDRTGGLTPTERRAARRRILARAKKIGIDTSGWEKTE